MESLLIFAHFFVSNLYYVQQVIWQTVCDVRANTMTERAGSIEHCSNHTATILPAWNSCYLCCNVIFLFLFSGTVEKKQQTALWVFNKKLHPWHLPHGTSQTHIMLSQIITVPGKCSFNPHSSLKSQINTLCTQYSLHTSQHTDIYQLAGEKNETLADLFIGSWWRPNQS